jgi:flagellar hook protein FlgE
MGLTSSLYIGVSGLSASSEEISVVGDNIANVNTVGFKAGRAAFEDTLSQQLVNGGSAGLGTRLQTVQRILNQGALLNTGGATDLALQGSGFFVVRGSSDGRTGNFYTRAGAFSVTKDGYLSNLEGLRLQGFQATPNGTVTQAVGDLQVGSSSSPPLPTGNITLKANLQSDVAIPALAFDPADPNATSNFATSVTVYDSMGSSHQVDVYFARTADGAWDWHALADGAGLNGGVPGTATEIASGSLTFDSSGRMTAETQTSDFNPLNAVGPQAITFDLGDPTGGGGTGLAGITQYANPSTMTFQQQDGYAAGQLSDVQIDTAGRVVGAFTNGQTRVLGQVAVADFTSADRLQRLGSNLFGESPDSGPPLLGAPAEAGRAGIAAGALEQSNVDMAGEFVRMIAAQRAFQANSKTITTADQLLNELIQLKR